MTAPMIPVARPFSTGRVSAGTDAAACTDTGEAGRVAELTPASPVPHRLTAQVAHTHSSRDERLACEAEHATVMARLARA